MTKQIEVWAVSIEDCGAPSESWVFTTNAEALAKLRDWHMELALAAYEAYNDAEDVESANVISIVRAPDQLDAAINRHANAIMTVESIMPPPDTEVLGEALWDDRVVWLEKHTLTLAARKDWDDKGS